MNCWTNCWRSHPNGSRRGQHTSSTGSLTRFKIASLFFGTGYLGRLAFSGLRTAGVQVLGFCDNNSSLWGSKIVPYPPLFWKHWRSMPNEDRLELPERILERAGEMRPGYELLSDEASRREFRAQIRWRCLMDYSCLPAPSDPSEMFLQLERVNFECEPGVPKFTTGRSTPRSFKVARWRGIKSRLEEHRE